MKKLKTEDKKKNVYSLLTASNKLKTKNIDGWEIIKSDIEHSIVFPENYNIVEDINKSFSESSTEVNLEMYTKNTKTKTFEVEKESKIKRLDLKADIPTLKSEKKISKKNFSESKEILGKIKKIFLALNSIHNFLKTKSLKVYYERVKLSLEESVGFEVEKEVIDKFYFVFSCFVKFEKSKILEKNKILELHEINIETPKDWKFRMNTILEGYHIVEVKRKCIYTNNILDENNFTEKQKRINFVLERENIKIGKEGLSSILIGKKHDIETMKDSEDKSMKESENKNMKELENLSLKERIELRKKILFENMKKKSEKKKQEFVSNFKNSSNKNTKLLFLFKIEKKNVLNFSFIQKRLNVELSEIKTMKEFEIKEINCEFYVLLKV